MAGETTPTLPNPGGGLTGLGNDAQAIGSILGLLFGKPPTTTNQTVGPSTTTETNVVDPAAIDYTIRQMLEGNNGVPGLAAIVGGTQNAVGGYGGSTTNLMVNDLISRIVGNIANLTKTNVKTNSGQSNSSTTQTGAQPGAKEAAMLAALKALASAGKGGSTSKSGGGGSIKAVNNTPGGIDPSAAALETDKSAGDDSKEGGRPLDPDADPFGSSAEEGAESMAGASRNNGGDDSEPDNADLMGSLDQATSPFIDTDWDNFGGFDGSGGEEPGGGSDPTDGGPADTGGGPSDEDTGGGEEPDPEVDDLEE